MTQHVRTRIAPSPTGFLHLGTARTALYSWAYAKHHGGQFVLRIEDTDVARSTQDAVDQILASMKWLGLDYDEGPIYQMQRLDRYKAVVAQMLEAGTAYHCYCTPEELEATREAQRARGEKTLYDRRWRPEPGKVLPPVPEGVPPVVRFCNPVDGDVTWNDLVKGEITINNREIDDLIIVRPDGVPTYNFAVVVDDWDMAITHVFRGDEHINNTPWQINIFRALGAPLPAFGHLPVILGDDGQKLSKRRGAVSVTAYEENGYLPEAMLNYLARLGWSHGDDELFTREQMVGWFDGSHLSKSPAQWDAAKLAWVNGQYIKAKADDELAPLVAAQLQKRGIVADARLTAICALFKDRCETTVALADWAAAFYADVTPSDADRAQHVTDAVRPALATLADKLATVAAWDKPSIAAAIKEVLAAHAMKMPALAMPVRVLVMGTPQTPSLDAVLTIFSKEKVIERLKG
ncbi:glutamate--tRNA ligase [Variovorax arabinosiphilus]|uniref:glutamate--tRNA ligase n=1 Tax=Variovorax arabinosiphilus TaxID=3053498 RepID=UPI002575DAC4|nr:MULTISPECIES: glutamate--tRNA ligase [unclassified Variovorax]MDM0120023.1 glutamate--tRNA ligase [Variovorax sp. J2L1-78]MDM0128064.1 glutamate--tRNA ligase [Variovorax sp. J2L1-63]MDM0231764.1 glutamate--tRNA ligase [Variovorax sp. J2R1-6]